MRKTLSLAFLAVVAACGGSAEPPKAAEHEPLTVGKTPANTTDKAAGATASPPDATAKAGKPSGGPKAPPISLDSITTPGKVTVPAGKVVIVDFWATWCEPCKKSFPKLQELYVKYKASGLEIAAVSVDDEKKGIAEFAKAHGGAKFPIGWDNGKKVAGAYKPESMPTTFVIDKEGNIAHTHKGYRDGEMDEIEKEIKALF